MSRITSAWRALEREQRLAAVAAIGLFVSMFLPWYSKTDTFIDRGVAQATQTSLNAFEAFSFVEAAVLLVSAAVLAMLFARAEGRAFQLPGGDGLIVMIAGAWSALLIFYRLLDKPTLHGTQRITATVGVEWGIFVALLVALGLVYAGARMRATEAPQAPLTRPRADPARSARRDVGASTPTAREGAPAPEPEEELTALAPPPRRRRSAPVAAEPRPAGSRPRYPPAPSPAPAPAEQMSFEDPPPPED
jgi:hypothetical protein